jgi:hypothetical protein
VDGHKYTELLALTTRNPRKSKSNGLQQGTQLTQQGVAKLASTVRPLSPAVGVARGGAAGSLDAESTRPRSGSAPTLLSSKPTALQIAALALFQLFKGVDQHLVHFLKNSQLKNMKYFNTRHLSIHFELHDIVLLNLKHIKTDQPCCKFVDRYFGPYEVIEKISKVAYRLDLGPYAKIYPVFHVSLLEKYNKNTIPNCIIDETVLDIILSDDGEHEEWEVDKVLALKHFRRKLHYLVK